ncbi:MAG: hydrogenase 4 subunit B [Betaproteobacteria bacterium RIFCSPLOWO2_12_FULL_68_19]|nr:MAG: hydrogenase 4 subunit B [Betaproteobacteria bacterium RIFCSPLOWO2_12_FULL_68_19]
MEPLSSPLFASLLAAVSWLVIAALALVPAGNAFFARRLAFPLGALIGLSLASFGLQSIWLHAEQLTLPLGLPDLPFHLRIDPLAGFFLLLLGSVSAGISVYAGGYFRTETAGRLALISLQYHMFLASMAFVILADDAYLFMVAWETMALSSYFLVTTDHERPAIRSAGFLYLLVAHLGAIAILLCFGVMHGGGDYSFDALRGAELTPFWATVAFLLAFFGFGAKAGMIPLHAWLPEAHPAAPSPVSALMSGIMLKTAIYGMVRVIYDLIGGVRWEWGIVVLAIGAGTTLFGVLYALMQHDLKRLLAYHSVENIGIILLGLGMSMVFLGFGHPLAGALGLVAALYHTLNHAVFKALLFLGAGSILHATGLRNLNDMGGLIRTMPKTALYFLIGALAISALPPLNGFVSEWLTFQTALQAPLLEHGVVRSLLPLFAATLALAGALTAMCFVKVYGIAFLGRPREVRHPAHARAEGGGHDAGSMEQYGMAWLAAGCLVLGLFPTSFLLMLNRVGVSLTGQGLSPEALESSWLWLVPTAPERASYSPIIFLLVVLAVVLITIRLVRGFYHGRVRVADPWDCGFPEQTTRMQDTADAFGQPIRHVFGPLYLMKRHLPGPEEANPRYSIKIEDRHWYWLYLPVARLADYASSKVGLLQRGRISIYLLYSFLTLIALLIFVR